MINEVMAIVTCILCVIFWPNMEYNIIAGACPIAVAITNRHNDIVVNPAP